MNGIVSHSSLGQLWHNARLSEAASNLFREERVENTFPDTLCPLLTLPAKTDSLMGMRTIAKADIGPISIKQKHLTEFAMEHKLDLPIHLLAFNREVRRSAKNYYFHSQLCLPDSLPFIRYREFALGLPELAILQMACSLSEMDLLKLAYELCGSYVLDDRFPRGFGSCKPLSSRSRIRSFAMRLADTRGTTALLKATELLSQGASASPKETGLAMMLSAPPSRGGYGLPLPELNTRVDLGAKARKLYQHPYCVCDLLLPGLDIEYDSWAEHESKDSGRRDSHRSLALALEGLEVIHVYDAHVKRIEGMDSLALLIAAKLGIGISIPQDPLSVAKRESLRSRLLGTHVSCFQPRGA